MILLLTAKALDSNANGKNVGLKAP